MGARRYSARGLTDDLIDALAVARITRLITKDKIAEPLRDRWAARYVASDQMSYLITCPWCVSVYVALAVSAARAAVPGWRYLARALASSQIAGLIANIDVDV